MSDIDFLGKVLAAVAAVGGFFALSLPVSLKTWKEYSQLLRVQRRSEYEFAIKFSEKSGDENVRRYAEEIGYAALIGDRHLTHKQRLFLLSLPDADVATSDYLSSRELIKIDTEAWAFAWTEMRYRSPRYRKFKKIGSYIAYVSLIYFAFLPVLYQAFSSKQVPTSWIFWILQFVWAVLMIAAAIFCLGGASRTKTAESLMLRLK